MRRDPHEPQRLLGQRRNSLLSAAWLRLPPTTSAQRSAAEVYENALKHQDELSILNRYECLAEHPVLLVEAALDSVAPADKMMRPLWEKLKELSAPVTYKILVGTHSFAGQRMKLAKAVAEWIEDCVEGQQA